MDYDQAFTEKSLVDGTRTQPHIFILIGRPAVLPITLLRAHCSRLNAMKQAGRSITAAL